MDDNNGIMFDTTRDILVYVNDDDLSLMISDNSDNGKMLLSKMKILQATIKQYIISHKKIKFKK